MFLETVRSEGLAHLSYIFGDGGKAAVIDPRIDGSVYIGIAHRHGVRITHIFETHRNEDYVIGSSRLAEHTGAEIFHGRGLPFEYGNTVEEGDTFRFGKLSAGVLSTPGHTYESISITLADTGFSPDPIAVFTGDALFIGDVGRTDFFPDKAEEVAGLLYDSIFGKLLPLGDHVILHPAHGAGSVCGSSLAPREFSTLGYERAHNPVLQLIDRKEFIRHKVNEYHYRPPYFRKMEDYNLSGSFRLDGLPEPAPCGAEEFAGAMDEGMSVIDTRSPEEFAGAYVPGSLSLPLDLIPVFAGWFVPYDREIGLVASRYEDVDTAVRFLLRIGYRNTRCYLEKGMQAWATSGRGFETMPVVSALQLKERFEAGEEFTLLDVRGRDEIERNRLAGATCIYLGELPGRLEEIPKERPVTTFCGMGERAMIAASILRNNGFEKVEDCLGSMEACLAVGCPAAEGEEEKTGAGG